MSFNINQNCSDKIGLNLLDEVTEFPQAVVNRTVIELNARWMAEFASRANVALAPHAKTTLAPKLLKQQIRQGTWGLSVATVAQIPVAISAGAKRILLANQLVGKAHFAALVALLKTNATQIYCFVDNERNLSEIADFFSANGVSLNVLIEYGVGGGRAGCRSKSQVLALAKKAHELAGVSLAGLAFYEGVINTTNTESAIVAFAQQVSELASHIEQLRLFNSETVVITGAGSAWYDLVCEGLSDLTNSPRYDVVIRPGCYLIQDTGIYQQAHQALRARSQLACSIDGDLSSGLALWAYITSTPEPGRAIVGFGKRDVAFDAGLPTPERLVSTLTKQSQTLDTNWVITKIMDHHAMLSYPVNCSVAVGDLIEVSTSHPCLTFDKWRQLLLVDDELTIVDTLETHF